MSEPKGAGTAGGLLFTLVMLFLAYLAVTAIAGFIRWVVGAALIVVAILLIGRVLSRR